MSVAFIEEYADALCKLIKSLNGLETELSEVPFVSAAASALPATASSDARLTPPASSSQVCEGRRQVSSE